MDSKCRKPWPYTAALARDTSLIDHHLLKNHESIAHMTEIGSSRVKRDVLAPGPAPFSPPMEYPVASADAPYFMKETAFVQPSLSVTMADASNSIRTVVRPWSPPLG